jgi:hypothetical protein
MRTPAGTDCKFFYGNYFRGRKDEECRLIGSQPGSQPWTPDLCAKCPVPGILLANACPHMQLMARARRALFGLMKGVDVAAFCEKSQQPVAEPHIGCGQCNPLPFDLMDTK